MMSSRLSGALEVRFSIFPNHVFSTVFRRNFTALCELELQGNSHTSRFQNLCIDTFSLISSLQVLGTQSCPDYSHHAQAMPKDDVCKRLRRVKKLFWCQHDTGQVHSFPILITILPRNSCKPPETCHPKKQDTSQFLPVERHLSGTSHNSCTQKENCQV